MYTRCKLHLLLVIDRVSLKRIQSLWRALGFHEYYLKFICFIYLVHYMSTISANKGMTRKQEMFSFRCGGKIHMQSSSLRWNTNRSPHGQRNHWANLIPNMGRKTQSLVFYVETVLRLAQSVVVTLCTSASCIVALLWWGYADPVLK